VNPVPLVVTRRSGPPCCFLAESFSATNHGTAAMEERDPEKCRRVLERRDSTLANDRPRRRARGRPARYSLVIDTGESGRTSEPLALRRATAPPQGHVPDWGDGPMRDKIRHSGISSRRSLPGAAVCPDYLQRWGSVAPRIRFGSRAGSALAHGRQSRLREPRPELQESEDWVVRFLWQQ